MPKTSWKKKKVADAACVLKISEPYLAVDPYGKHFCLGKQKKKGLAAAVLWRPFFPDFPSIEEEVVIGT